MAAAYNLEAADDLSVPPKHPNSDLVEVNKIGKEHLAGGGKMVAVHRMFTFASPETALWGKRCPTMSRFLWYN